MWGEDSYHDMPTAEDLAYQGAQDQFDRLRSDLIDKAADAYEKGDEELSKKLWAEAMAMKFTGLQWASDDIYGYKEE